jgi:hypothetical protein
VEFDYYEVRIYDKHLERLIYRARYLYEPSATFPFGRTRSTGEDLIPGEQYFFRAMIVKSIDGTTLQGNRFKLFEVPK